jgi:hypothetical protein
MRFKTATGSVYELDQLEKKVRRLTGVENPTPRQGTDGEWKEYKSVSRITTKHGTQFFFDWTGLGNGTTTSPVIELEHDDGIPSDLETVGPELRPLLAFIVVGKN